MHRKQVNQHSPIRILERSIQGGLGKGNLGLVMARAGVGKTSCLIQIGLDALLRDRPVLHVALDRSVAHVQSWYDALFDDLARRSGLPAPEDERRATSARRLITSFTDHHLSPERLDKTVEMFSHNLDVTPAAILIDGYRWDQHSPAENAAFVGAFKSCATRCSAELWMTAQTHHNLDSDHPTRLPPPFETYRSLVDVALFLEPDGDDVSLRLLLDHGDTTAADTRLHLHPDTLRMYAEGEKRQTISLPTSAFTLLSGGAKGTEAEFGKCAEAWGLTEINFSFDGRSPERNRGVVNLTDEELAHGSVSPVYIQSRLHRSFPDAPLFRKMLQSIWHQVNTAGEVFCIGVIQPDHTVKGGTGWAAELARNWNKPVHVFDQERHGWYVWHSETWKPAEGPVITQRRFCGTGTRFVSDDGREAIRALFERSFGDP